MTSWYKALSCDNVVENPLVSDTADLGVDPGQLDIGKLVTRWDDAAWLRAAKPKNDGTADDVLQNHLGLAVFSGRLRAALEAAGVQGIQYLPVHIFKPNGQEVVDFSIANIVERRHALGLSRSDYDVFPGDYFLPDRRGKICAVRRATLVARALEGCDAVRLDGFFVSVYVSERFKDAFETGGFTGYSFHQVSSS